MWKKILIYFFFAPYFVTSLLAQESKSAEDSLTNLFFNALEQRNLKKAEAYVKEGMALMPGSATWQVLMGNLNIEKGEYDLALKAFTKAIELESDWSNGYNERGILYSELGEYELAIADFNIGIQYAENDNIKGSFYTNRALPKQYLQDWEGAYQDLKQALVYNPNDIGALVNLGSLCGEMGKTDEAIKYLEYGLEIIPDEPGLINNLAFIYVETGAYDQAIQMFSRNIDSGLEVPIAMNNRAYCYFKKGDLKTAMKEVNESIKLYPENSYAYRNRALMYLEKNKIDEACEDLVLALRYGFTEMYGGEVLELQSTHCR